MLQIFLQGDSGGPLYVHEPQGQCRQIGVLIIGSRPCGTEEDAPDIYVNVGNFKDWIMSIIS